MNGQASLLEAAKQCDRAAAACGTPGEMVEIMRVLQHREAIQIATANAKINRVAKTSMRQKELLPLRDDGDDFGRIEARIPKDLFYGLMQQGNFGHDGFMSDDGMRDFAKEYPQFMVKTVTGKTTAGYGTKRKPGVTFGRGTMKFAE
jgi:hypothetical protein